MPVLSTRTAPIELSDAARADARVVLGIVEARPEAALSLRIASDSTADADVVVMSDSLARFVLAVMDAVGRGADVLASTLPEELTTTAAAERLGISRPTLMKLIADGSIAARKVGTHTRLRRDDVLALRDERAARRAAAIEELTTLDGSFD